MSGCFLKRTVLRLAAACSNRQGGLIHKRDRQRDAGAPLILAGDAQTVLFPIIQTYPAVHIIEPEAALLLIRLPGVIADLLQDLGQAILCEADAIVGDFEMDRVVIQDPPS